jgi:hypothetical protein
MWPSNAMAPHLGVGRARLDAMSYIELRSTPVE